MRINAYVLAADPAWLVPSVAAYYSLVERIIVSYDESARSWTGTPLEVDACLTALKALDTENKMVLSPGHYARLDHKPLENDTYQRQCALDEASNGADWVLQLDTDEVINDVDVFISCLQEADARGFDAMDFPARNFYRQVDNRRFLEHCGRFWRVAAGFPGPVAIRAGSALSLCRQSTVTRFRVDFRAANTDPWQSRHSAVHRIVHPREGIYHLSWVRTDDYMARKSRWSGHAADYDWTTRLSYWSWSGRHPVQAVARTPLQPRRSDRRLRLSTVTGDWLEMEPV